MRIAVVAISVILFSGCKPSPNTDKIAADAKTQFQLQLDQDYADNHAIAQKVSIVKTNPTKYDGEATIAVYNSTLTVPLIVTSDGNTTLVTADNQKLVSEFGLALQHDLANMVGKYSDYILSPTMFEMMPASLNTAKADFVARLQVVVPIDTDDRYYFGTGCMAHECDVNAAAWAIDKMTGKGTAIIMEYVPSNPAMASHEDFRLYGTTTDNLPPALVVWANQAGMTEANVVPDTPAYQAPQK